MAQNEFHQWSNNGTAVLYRGIREKGQGILPKSTAQDCQMAYENAVANPKMLIDEKDKSKTIDAETWMEQNLAYKCQRIERDQDRLKECLLNVDEEGSIQYELEKLQPEVSQDRRIEMLGKEYLEMCYARFGGDENHNQLLGCLEVTGNSLGA